MWTIIPLVLAGIMVGDLVSVSTGKGTFSVRPERLTLAEV